jgi:hypothetical protein
MLPIMRFPKMKTLGVNCGARPALAYGVEM